MATTNELPLTCRALVDLGQQLADMRAERDRLRQAVAIGKLALKAIGDDYPGSSCQVWCRQVIAQMDAAVTLAPPPL